jgi:hypothetical protein
VDTPLVPDKILDNPRRFLQVRRQLVLPELLVQFLADSFRSAL